jgi:hypothetical protein
MDGARHRTRVRGASLSVEPQARRRANGAHTFASARKRCADKVERTDVADALRDALAANTRTSRRREERRALRGTLLAGVAARFRSSRETGRNNMANEVAIQRRNGGGSSRTPARRDLDPYRIMRDLLEWSPLSRLTPTSFAGLAFLPDFDVKATREAFVFTADLPGVAEKDLEIQLTQNRLSISGYSPAARPRLGAWFGACLAGGGHDRPPPPHQPLPRRARHLPSRRRPPGARPLPDARSEGTLP